MQAEQIIQGPDIIQTLGLWPDVAERSHFHMNAIGPKPGDVSVPEGAKTRLSLIDAQGCVREAVMWEQIENVLRNHARSSYNWPWESVEATVYRGDSPQQNTVLARYSWKIRHQEAA